MRIYAVSPLARLVMFVFSLALMAVIYFAVVKPALDDADKQTSRALDQSQQALDQGQKQLDASQKRIDEASKESGGTSGSTKGATDEASKRLDNASKLTGCLADAGTDVSAVQDCQAKYAP
ncbi:MAG: hypothetical protein H0V29_05865 [Thermoleophilaceae bacterium]|nr:hypothetical protein [Thermoleophilaceae bacterium]